MNVWTTGFIPAGQALRRTAMGNENHAAGGEDLYQSCPNVAGSRHWLLPGAEQPQQTSNCCSEVARKKKNLQERNQGKWVCGRDGFVAVVALFKSDPLEGNIKTC